MPCRKCVVCHERLASKAVAPWCLQCWQLYCAASKRPGEFDRAEWSARRARAYERRRWMKAIDNAGGSWDYPKDCTVLGDVVRAVRRAKKW